MTGCASAATARAAALGAARTSRPTLSTALSIPVPSAEPTSSPVLWATVLEEIAEHLLEQGWDAEATEVLGAAGALRERAELVP